MRWPWVSPKEFRGLQGNMKGFESFMSRILSQMQRIEGDFRELRRGVIDLKAEVLRQKMAVAGSGSSPSTVIHYSATVVFGRMTTTCTMGGTQTAELFLYDSDRLETKIAIRTEKHNMHALEAAVGKKFWLDLRELVDDPGQSEVQPKEDSSDA